MKIKLQSSTSSSTSDKIFVRKKVTKSIGLKRDSDFSLKDRLNLVIEGQSSGLNLTEFCFKKGISLEMFQRWANDHLSNAIKLEQRSDVFKQDEKFRIVIEGKSGVLSVGEICQREGIDHSTFLEWSKEFVRFRKKSFSNTGIAKSNYYRNRLLVSKFSGDLAANYIENYIDFSSSDQLIIKNSKIFLTSGLQPKYNSIICSEKINDIRFINKYFEKVNDKLVKGGLFVGCLETFSERRKKSKINSIPIIRNIFFPLEFLVKRMMPKLSFTKKLYFDFTKGEDRLLSKAEGLGRLVSCGFQIMDYSSINGLIFFVVKKVANPSFDMNPSYGPVYRMPRIGKNGQIINVYKFRTMHPYSEYLQDYVLNVNGYADSGKPAQDFRIPHWGKFMRRFWLDELPQLLNVLNGDMKLVGIRPVSKRYFQDIPKEMQRLRLTQKPGCIPPYVSLNRAGNVMSVLQAEKEYLEEKIKKPLITDSKYFFKAVVSILFYSKRSA